VQRRRRHAYRCRTVSSRPVAAARVVPWDEATRAPVQAASSTYLDPDQLGGSDVGDLADEINAGIALARWWPWMFGATGLVFLASSGHATITSTLNLLAGLAATWWTWRRDRRRRTTTVEYDLDAGASGRLEEARRALAAAGTARRAWWVEAEVRTGDWKCNGGAETLQRRRWARVGSIAAHFVVTNAPVSGTESGKTKLLTLLEAVRLSHRGRYAAVPYESLWVQATRIRFSETYQVPDDTPVVDTTWLYVRRDGGQDRRFAANRQIPVIEFGEPTFRSADGLRAVFHVFDPSRAQACADAFGRVQQGYLAAKLESAGGVRDPSKTIIQMHVAPPNPVDWTMAVCFACGACGHPVEVRVGDVLDRRTVECPGCGVPIGLGAENDGIHEARSSDGVAPAVQVQGHAASAPARPGVSRSDDAVAGASPSAAGAGVAETGAGAAWVDVARWAWFCAHCARRNSPGTTCSGRGADAFALHGEIVGAVSAVRQRTGAVGRELPGLPRCFGPSVAGWRDGGPHARVRRRSAPQEEGVWGGVSGNR
jgi:hypothetical protein